MAASKADLLGNATHWLKEAKRNHLGDQKVGAIFIFFNQEDLSSAVCAGSVPRELIKRHLRAIIAKIDKDASRLVTPYDA